jgi:hypothetical protein
MRFANIAAVESLIQNEIPESVSLEFKSELSLEGRDARRELLKDLTGMANGGGGSIIFGMEEESGTNAAKATSPLPALTIIGQMQDIVRAGVRPPLVWSCEALATDGGWVVVADVEPSTLGPYMVDGYGEKRYYKRAGASVHPMSEQEVRDAYAVAARAIDRRDRLWQQHTLPIQVPAQQPWLVVSALPQEPLGEIFDARTIDLAQFVAPPPLEHYQSHTRLVSTARFLRLWRDGLTAEDGDDAGPNSVIRLFRDGAAGIAERLEPELKVEWVVRMLNAYLLYCAWFWNEFSLARPVELVLSIARLRGARLSSGSFLGSNPAVVNPFGVIVDDVAVAQEVLPWELLRAPIRHDLLRRFCERLVQAFGQPGVAELFERGWLYDRAGQNTGLVLSRSGIADGRQGMARATVYSSGQVHSATQIGHAFVLDGALVDGAGGTVALVEMATGTGCPDTFVPDISVVERAGPAQNWGDDPPPDPEPVVPPTVNGTWSELAPQDLLR